MQELFNRTAEDEEDGMEAEREWDAEVSKYGDGQDEDEEEEEGDDSGHGGGDTISPMASPVLSRRTL